MVIGIPEIILAIITVVSPLITALANQSKWDPKVKNAVAFGVALVIAVVYLIFTGGTDWSDVPTAILAVYGLQQLVYKQFLTELSKKVEAVSSVKPGEKVVVADDKPNVIEETGGDNAEVVLIDGDKPADENLPNYQAGHRGDVPLG